MSHNTTSGIVAVGEMLSVTLSMGIFVVVIDWYAETDVYLSCVNK